MACACGKNGQAASPRGMSGSRAAAQVAADKTVQSAAAARSRASSSRSMDASPPPAERTQSFSLRTRDGKVQRYGSSLEARAERIRQGGEIVP